MLAGERVERALGAVERVPGYVEARRPATVLELEQLEHKASEAAAYWDRLSERASGARTLERIVAKHAKAEARRAKVRWQKHHAKAARWAWRLVTISPAWRPWDPAELELEALEARRDSVLERWASVWDRIATRGLAGAIVSVECSSGGHVHLHALVYSGWLSSKWLRKVAGCFVDVREAKARPQDIAKHGASAAAARALREAVKYAIKSPSPARRSWQAGERWRVMSPELAARWTVASEGAQLGRVYGVLRDALAAESAIEETPSAELERLEPHAGCPNCKAPLAGEPRKVSVRTLARELDTWEWRHRVRWRRIVPEFALGRKLEGAAKPIPCVNAAALSDGW